MGVGFGLNLYSYALLLLYPNIPSKAQQIIVLLGYNSSANCTAALPESMPGISNSRQPSGVGNDDVFVQYSVLGFGAVFLTSTIACLSTQTK